MNQKKMNIDFKQIQEFADKPVHRAAAFMGLGLNAAYDENFKNYQLVPITQIEIISSNLTDSSISHLKNEFAQWIIAGGLNELIEGFESFLMKIISIPLVINLKKGAMSLEEARKERSKFNYLGLKRKLILLREKYNLILANASYLESLAYTRNCFTHRHGIVGHADLKNGQNELTIEWKGMDVFVSKPDGEEITIIPSGGREEIFLKDGGNVKLRVDVVRTLKFAKGQMIQLSPHHLAEICCFVKRTSRQFIQETQSYVKKQGIPEEDPKTEG